MGFYIVFLVVCLMCGFFLFKKIPRIQQASSIEQHTKLTVIIPVRNEQSTLPLLLDDLSHQTLENFDIICIDDDSDDDTFEIIKAAGVNYIKVPERPSSWMGKTWACQIGGEQATGDLLLFIDADVRVGPKTLNNLVKAYLKEHHVISVQPYHMVDKFFEQFAFFFNVIGVAANGVGFPYANKKAGLFGPVILMSKLDFLKIDGYNGVKDSIIEDVEMGNVFDNNGILYDVFVGDKDLYFKMYSNFGDLFLGYSKNFASGAGKTPIVLLTLTFLWIQALTALPLLIIISLFQTNYVLLGIIAIIYTATVMQLMYISGKIGSFRKIYNSFYPVSLMLFHLVCLYSGYLKHFKKNVKWKGRDISLER